MDTVAVNVRRVDGTGGASAAGAQAVFSADELTRDLARCRMLAWLLDANFSIGKIRFGWDAIIGLVPGIGDTTTALIGLYIVYVAWKHKLGNGVIGAMLGNLLFDWLVGLIPWLGDMFDVVFKAHLRNLKILETAIQRRGV